MRTALILCLAAGLPLAVSALAAPKPAPEPVGRVPFDTNAVHDLYLEGDFDQAIAELDRAMREQQLRGHADSVFAYKHLGVMFAAREETREKGKYYMLQLLRVEPTAKILDMYASDMIYMIFHNLKEEYEESRVKLQRANAHLLGNRQASGGDSSGIRPPTDPSPARRSLPAAGPAAVPPAGPATASISRKPERRLWYLVGAAAAAVGVGVVAYLADGESPPKKVVYEVE